MKCDKDKIDGIVYEIMINNIGNTRDGFEKELVTKLANAIILVRPLPLLWHHTMLKDYKIQGHLLLKHWTKY